MKRSGILTSCRTFIFITYAFFLWACSTIPNTESLTQKTSSDELWQSYLKSPNNHPNIPNASYAGYRSSEIPIPSPHVVVNVVKWAKGDGKTDDTDAFKQAINYAYEHGGGAIFIPEGNYRINGMIHLDRPGIVLRGEGPAKTIIHFENPLTALLGQRPTDNGPESSEYSWLGGLIHVGVYNDLGPTGKLNAKARFPQSWTPGDQLCKVKSNVMRGSDTIVCDLLEKKSVKVGQWVMLRLKNIPDHSLLDEIEGMKGFPWESSPESKISGEMLLDKEFVNWPVQIRSVSKKNGKSNIAEVVFHQPIRFDIQEKWEPTLSEIGPVTSEVGIEEMTLQMKDHFFEDHHNEKGFSGIYFNRVVNGWVRNVHMENVDNGFIGSAIKNVTVSGLEISYSGTLPGQKNVTHHGTVLRQESHDNLFTDFKISSPIQHGIEVEGLSSGNVWRRGIMKHGTFDSHRLMPFDLIRTSIEINNDGRPGGNQKAGPSTGARVVHWNIALQNSSRWIYQPDHLSHGALVGIRGMPISFLPSESMIRGDKHTVIADDNRMPVPSDLFEAELKHRLDKDPCGEIIQCGAFK